MKHIVNDWYVLLFWFGAALVLLCVVEGIAEIRDRRRARKATDDFEAWLKGVTESSSLFDQDSQEA